MRLKAIGAGVAAVLAMACVQPAAAANFSIPDVLSYPFVVDLVSAPQANRIAWVRMVRGVRNVWVADGPDAQKNGVLFDTRLRGNGNAGHTYGRELSVEDREALLEYLKTL